MNVFCHACKNPHSLLSGCLPFNPDGQRQVEEMRKQWQEAVNKETTKATDGKLNE